MGLYAENLVRKRYGVLLIRYSVSATSKDQKAFRKIKFATMY